MTSSAHSHPKARVEGRAAVASRGLPGREPHRPASTKSGPCPAPSRRMLAFAQGHEQAGELYPGWRRWLVSQLGLTPGQVVIDAGCGGGANFPALRSHLGPTGMIIGIEESPELRAVAAHWAATGRWRNMTLLARPADLAAIPPRADAVLFCGAHDILQQPDALRHIVAALRPGARVVAGGPKWPASWLGPMLRHYQAVLHRRYVRDFAGFDQPWRHLAQQVGELQVRQLGFGTAYLAHRHL